MVSCARLFEWKHGRKQIKEYFEHRTEKTCRWIGCRLKGSRKASWCLDGGTGLMIMPVTEMARTKNGMLYSLDKVRYEVVRFACGTFVISMTYQSLSVKETINYVSSELRK